MQFLCIIPKHSREHPPEASVVHECVTRIVQAVDSSYRSFLGPAYGIPTVRSASANSTAFVSVWDRTNDNLQENYYVFGDRWVATAGQQVAEKIHKNVVPSGGSLRYRHPVWGTYACIVGERYTDRVSAWCTTPALESIHYGSNNEYVFISNRPLIVSLALGFGRASDVQLSDDYLAEYLAYGYSISGITPFSGVHTVPANKALSVVKGAVDIVLAPAGLASGLEPDHTSEEAAEALATALINAMARTAAEVKDRPLQLRLSGGKDSRLLMGLLRNHELNTKAVTYGVPTDGDVQYASKLASIVGMPHWVGAPLPATGVGTEEQTLRTIMECGGIPPSEPHLVTSAGSNPEHLNDAIMLGQWPLFKGGMAKVVRYPRGGIEKTLQKQIAPFLTTEVRQLHERYLRSWFDEVYASSELEKLYLFAREFRSGKYLHSHIVHYARDAMIAYPISDAEVTAVSDDLTMYEKVSQRSLFLALRQIWPEALSIPLHNSTWRFEAGGPADISGPDYSARNAEPPDNKVSDAALGDGSAPNAYSPELVNQLCRLTVSSELWVQISSLITGSMKLAILDSSKSGNLWHYSHAEPNLSPREFAKYVWRIYVADRWRSRAWIGV